MALNMTYGIRRIFDANQRFLQPGLATYLRVRNFADPQTQPWAQYGFSISPSGSAQTGTTDILIDPPPSHRMVSMHNIAMSAGKLRFGAREIIVSHTFVLQQMDAWNLQDPTLVFRGPNIVGFVLALSATAPQINTLASIEQYSADVVAGDILAWVCLCNCNELR